MLFIFLLVIVNANQHVLHQKHHDPHHHQKNLVHVEDAIYAISILYPDNNSGVNGVVKMMQSNGKTRIQAKITGLSDGLHGFHIHEWGDLLQGCHTAGGHYNPHKKHHGNKDDLERHVGDLGNLVQFRFSIKNIGNVKSLDQVALFDYTDDLIHLSGKYSVIGRSFVVHEDEDDLGKGNNEASKENGNAGARLACGVIGLSSPLEFD